MRSRTGRSSALERLTSPERLNFLLTNRIPRRLATSFMGWFSRIEQPLVRDASIAVWRLFADLDLHEAREQRFRSLHHCFTRELRPGARTIDPRPGVLVSPCDAIVGACGPVRGTEVFQAKGFPYALEELLPDLAAVERYRDGTFVTLRLTSSMYHRFHAPLDCHVSQVVYVSGDTWNVNPIALRRIEKLFCKNERALVELELAEPERQVALVPVAAILVASLRLHCLGAPLDLAYRGPNVIECDADYARGEEMGYFQHGSTILVFTGAGYRLCEGIGEGYRVRMGEALMRHDSATVASS